MNNPLWQLGCMALLILCVMWNRAAWGDPKWPLLALTATAGVWVLLALYVIAATIWGFYRGLVGEEIGGLSAFVLLLAIVPLLSVVVFLFKALQVPPIHDISTDVSNPPEFVLAKEARHKSHNSLLYASQNAELQSKAYPNVSAFVTPLRPVELFVVVEKVIHKLGWDVHGIDKDSGVIEAYDTTPLLQFVDDIVIRITPRAEAGSQLDIRSASRIGKSDLGANAARIQLFFEELAQQLALTAQATDK